MVWVVRIVSTTHISVNMTSYLSNADCEKRMKKLNNCIFFKFSAVKPMISFSLRMEIIALYHRTRLLLLL